MQQSRFLESKTKFAFNNHRSKSQYSEDTFSKWSNTNFYRTSYNDMGVAKVKQSARRRTSPPRAISSVVLIPFS